MTTAHAQSLEASCVGLLINGESSVEAKDCGSILNKVISGIENEHVRHALTVNADIIGIDLTKGQRTLKVADGSKKGFCRVSNALVTQIYDNEPCTKTLRSCDAQGACVIDFTWPSGSKTVVESRYSDLMSAYRINGQNAGMTNGMGEGGPFDCTLNFQSEKMFCFSETRVDQPLQSANIPPLKGRWTMTFPHKIRAFEFVSSTIVQTMVKDPFWINEERAAYKIENGNILFSRAVGSPVTQSCSISVNYGVMELKNCTLSQFEGSYTQ